MTWPQRSEPAPAARRSPGPAAAGAPPHICCGQRLRQHDVEPKQSQLSFTYCGRCESLRWFRDHLPVPADGGPPEHTSGVGPAAAGNQARTS
jgi:hypothetical protein